MSKPKLAANKNKPKAFKEKQLSASIRTGINKNYQVDTDGDSKLLQENNEGWDDLNHLKNTIAEALIMFRMEVGNILTHKEITDNLGDRRAEFTRLNEVFDTDINRFADTIQELRTRHESKTGSITSVADMNDFTNISMKYQVLQMELHSLLAPTLASMVLLISEVVTASLPTNVNVVTDVEVKNESV